MCGIFGIIGQKDAANKTFKGLSDIEYRGYDSWGVAYTASSSFRIKKDIGFLPRQQFFPNSSLALGHTRWATHGGVTKQNAHPHLDCLGKIVLVHNGIVENYLELKQSLTNHQFQSETDTEVVIHLIEEELKKSNNLIQAVRKAFSKLSGLNALVVSDGQEIVAVKNSSPLVVGKLDQGFAIASDPNALLPFSKNLLFLEDGQLVSLGQNLQLFSSKGLKKLKPHLTQVKWDYVSSSMDKFPHFMLKEIYEQPRILRQLAHNSKEIGKVANLVKAAHGTFLIACGSASYSCLAGVYLFSKLVKKHVNFSIGSEFQYIQNYLTRQSLLIAISQSGETIDVIEPVTSAKKKGAKIVGITNTLGSTLYRLSDQPWLLEAGPEKAVCSTKALIAMFAAMILLAARVAGKRKLSQTIINQSADEAEKILNRVKEIKKLASKIYQSKHIYILGRGLSYPVALESALKIKESTYIHAEGFAGGELKHGVIALIEKGVPVIIYLPKDETKEAILANAMEVKARGAYVIGVGVENNPAFDYFFAVKDTGASSIIPHTVFAQLLAYFLAVKLNLNPDKPRNLAKSVVVR